MKPTLIGSLPNHTEREINMTCRYVLTLCFAAPFLFGCDHTFDEEADEIARVEAALSAKGKGYGEKSQNKKSVGATPSVGKAGLLITHHAPAFPADRANQGTRITQVEAMAKCESPRWHLLRFKAHTPKGTWITFTGFTAATYKALDHAEPLELAAVPGDVSPVQMGPLFEEAQIPQGRFMRVRVALSSNEAEITPTLHGIRLHWTCGS